ncbi:exonuclease, partial [Salmonella enterica]|nr:exonuclease [Salmonella enterica]
ILKKTDAKYIDKTKNAIASVLKKDAEDIDIKSFKDHEQYYWYRYLFLGRGKPLSHNYVLNKLDNDSLKNDAPIVLKELIKKVRGLL